MASTGLPPKGGEEDKKRAEDVKKQAAAQRTTGSGEGESQPLLTFRTQSQPSEPIRESEVETATPVNETVMQKYWKYWKDQAEKEGRPLQRGYFFGKIKKDTIYDKTGKKDFDPEQTWFKTTVDPKTNTVLFLVDSPKSESQNKDKHQDLETKRSKKISLQMEGLKVYTKLELEEKMIALHKSKPDLSMDEIRNTVIEQELKKSPNIFEFKVPYVARGQDAAQILIHAENHEPKLIPKLSQQAENKLRGLKENKKEWESLTEAERTVIDNYFNGPKTDQKAKPPQLG